MKHINKDFTFVVMGDGPLKEKFENEARGLPVIFLGRIPYSEMCWVLKHCDIAINPIEKGAAQSIINKHMDYAMAGLPVVNTQECSEYRNILNKFNAGINCKCGDSNDVSCAINKLMNDFELRKEMSANSRRMGEKCFDRQISYKKILDFIYK